MVWGIFKEDSVSEAYKKMKAEELKGNQHKLDHDKDGKIEGEDLAKLRAQKEKENSMKYGKDVKEEAEQIDELSKGTLASYAKKASHDSRMNQKMSKDFELDAKGRRNKSLKDAGLKLAGHYQKKSWKRQDGVNKAIDRLAKEDYTEEDLDALINEVLSKDSTAGDWISDFVKSDNPKFAGKSKEKRKEMALAAYYSAQKKESTDYDSFVELDEEADLVKTGAKDIKHANIKDKEDDKDDFGPRAQGEKDFLDQLSVNVTDDPGSEYKSGSEKLAVSSKPTGKGAGKYDGASKTGIKKESTSEEAAIEEASCGDTKAKGKKTFSGFKEEMKTKKA